ncbi:MAG: phosphate acyltransferase, partial [Rhodoferax sp.]
MAPDVESDGELHGDAALSEEVRRTSLMDTRLSGEANVLMCPNLDAANILFNVLKMTGGHGVTVGPVLLGAAATVHVLTPSSTVRRVVNMTALAVATSAAERSAGHFGFFVRGVGNNRHHGLFRGDTFTLTLSRPTPERAILREL